MVSTAAARAASEPTGPSRAVSPRRCASSLAPVLLVTSRPGDEWAVRRLLTGLGYPVVSATSGEQALRVVSQHRGVLGLLVADVQLPGMSGFVLADVVAQHRPGIPTLLMVDGPMAVREFSTRRRPDISLLDKPVTIEAVDRALEAATRVPRGFIDEMSTGRRVPAGLQFGPTPTRGRIPNAAARQPAGRPVELVSAARLGWEEDRPPPRR